MRENLVLPADGAALWAGMGDYVLLTANGGHRVVLDYIGEPPFGDSYHRMTIDGVDFPGFAWGCLFATTPDGRYLAAEWMPRLYERMTILIDLETARFRRLDILFTTLAFADGLLICTDVNGKAHRVDVNAGEWIGADGGQPGITS